MQTLDTLTRYDASTTPHRPLERILRWLGELDDALRATGPEIEPEVDAAMRLDIRRYFFMLEGIFRLYRARYGAKAKEALRCVREMEDALGLVDYMDTMHETGERLELGKKVRTYLEEAKLKARRKLRKRLRAEWCQDANGDILGVARLVRTSSRLPWDDPQTDRRYLCGQLADELESIHDGDLDMDDLEDGVHELRRDIRWFSIYLTALDGFAALDDGMNPIPEYEPLLRSEAARSQFASLNANPREADPVRISRSLYIANTVYITELGELKDDGQTIEGLAFALRESSAKKKKKYRAREDAIEALDLEPGHLHFVHERSAVIYDEMKSRGLYHHLAQPFRNAAGAI